MDGRNMQDVWCCMDENGSGQKPNGEYQAVSESKLLMMMRNIYFQISITFYAHIFNIVYVHLV